MKHTLLLVTASILLAFCKAKTVLVERYAFSGDGLILRSAQSIDSQKMALIPFGTKILIELPNPSNKEMIIDGFKGEYVLCTYNNQKGYVFSGYLTIFPPPKKTANANWSQYLIDLYGKPSKTINNPRGSDSATERKHIEFANGAIFDEEYFLDGGNRSIQFPHEVQINDLILLIKATDQYAKAAKFVTDKSGRYYAKIHPYPEHGESGPVIEYTIELTNTGPKITQIWGI